MAPKRKHRQPKAKENEDLICTIFSYVFLVAIVIAVFYLAGENISGILFPQYNFYQGLILLKSSKILEFHANWTVEAKIVETKMTEIITEDLMQRIVHELVEPIKQEIMTLQYKTMEYEKMDGKTNTNAEIEFEIKSLSNQLHSSIRPKLDDLDNEVNRLVFYVSSNENLYNNVTLDAQKLVDQGNRMIQDSFQIMLQSFFIDGFLPRVKDDFVSSSELVSDEDTYADVITTLNSLVKLCEEFEKARTKSKPIKKERVQYFVQKNWSKLQLFPSIVLIMTGSLQKIIETFNAKKYENKLYYYYVKQELLNDIRILDKKIKSIS